MKKQNEPALGRGLDALLGGASTAVSTTGDVNNVSLGFIEPNPFQPRKEFDEESLKELAESIRHIGLVQPVTLKQLAAERYQIISGERRVRAARMAGLRSIPAYIRKVDDIGMLEMAIVENIQRENLDPIDTALSFQRLIEECNLTQEEMADRVGKKRSSVANYLRLLNLPPEIQKAVKEGKITMKSIKSTGGSSSGSTRIVHRVKSGETLGKIAAKYHTTVVALKKNNHLRGSIIRVGQRLYIYK